MTVIVQQPTDSNGNPQPMVYDSDTGKIIVDSNGYYINGGKRLINVPTKADYVSTPKTQTAGIAEACNYAMSNITNDNDSGGDYSMPTIELSAGNFVCTGEAFLQNNNLINTVIIKGQGASATNIDLTNMPADKYLFNISGLSYLFDLHFSGMRYVSNNTSSGSGGLLNYIPSSWAEVYINDVNQGSGGFSGHSLNIGGTTTQGTFLVQVNYCQGNLSFAEGWNIMYAHQVSLIGGNGWMTMQNCMSVISVGVHADIIQYIDCNTVTVIGSHNEALYLSGTIQNVTILGGESYNGFAVLNVMGNLTLDNLIVNGLTLIDATADVPFLYNPSTFSVTINNAQIHNTASNTTYNFYDIPVNSPTISVNPPVSGTTYQNQNLYAIRLKLPVTYNPTTTAGAVLATGTSSTSAVSVTNKVGIPAGLTAADGQLLTYDMVIPAGWYYQFVTQNATIGTAEIEAA